MLDGTEMEMNLNWRIERSHSREKIDFAAIPCRGLSDSLVAVQTSDRIRVEPIWTVEADMEGRLYADYITTHPGYTAVYVREGVLAHLKDAASKLPASYGLVLRAGHRPAEVQRRVLRDVANEYRSLHTGATDEEVMAHARTFVADPAVRRPGHCCGAAVDVELFDIATGDLADCGSPINADDEISFLHYEGVSSLQRDNRMHLLRAMLDAGFASYYAEWWHFAFGDESWAWFYKQDASLYDLIER